MPMKTLFASKLGMDSVLETEHLDDHGSPDGISVNGTDVFVNARCDNENGYGRRIAGQAFFAIGGNIGCVHS